MTHHLLFAAAGLFGLLVVFRAARWHARRHHGWHGHVRWGGGCHHHHHGGHGHGGARRGRVSPESFARAMGEVVKRRLRIAPDQEDIVDHALRDARESLRGLQAAWTDSRADLAGAFAGEEVDDAALAAAFERHDAELGRARQDLTSALKQVHAVLDEEQRARLVDLVAKGERGWL